MSANVSTTKHSISKIQVTIKSIERRGVMSSYHGSKILGSQQSFLTETAIGMVERWYKSMGYHFVPECNHAQESHTCQVVHFFHHIWRTKVCWNPEIWLPWQHDVTTSPLCYQYRFTNQPWNLWSPASRSDILQFSCHSVVGTTYEHPKIKTNLCYSLRPEKEITKGLAKLHDNFCLIQGFQIIIVNNY